MVFYDIQIHNQHSLLDYGAFLALTEMNKDKAVI